MSSIRITKAMAECTANKITQKKYDEEINELQAEISKEVELLVKKYVPSPVIACVNEYGEFFSTLNNAYVTTENKKLSDATGWCYRKEEIGGEISFKIPHYARTVFVSEDEYDKLYILYDKKRNLQIEQREFGNKVMDALLQLKTYKNVQEKFPEAVKYIDLPAGTNLPAPIYTELNNLVKDI